MIEIGSALSGRAKKTNQEMDSLGELELNVLKSFRAPNKT